jgi:flagellar hook-basal body complex protein FliE
MNPLDAVRFPAAPEFRVSRAATGISPLASPISAAELGSLQPTAIAGATQGASFGQMLGSMVNDVSARQSAASDAVSGLLSGGNVPLHQAMIAMEEASVSFQLMVEVRNKLLESYQELMRMQI